jgi:hypothetical protein
MPSSRAFCFTTARERFKATDTRNAETPDPISPFNLSRSFSDHALEIDFTDPRPVTWVKTF